MILTKYKTTYYLSYLYAGVKVRRLDEEGKSEPVYPTKVSLKAEYDPMVGNCINLRSNIFILDYDSNLKS